MTYHVSDVVSRHVKGRVRTFFGTLVDLRDQKKFICGLMHVSFVEHRPRNFMCSISINVRIFGGADRTFTSEDGLSVSTPVLAGMI